MYDHFEMGGLKWVITLKKKKKKVAGSHRRTHLTCPDERL